MENLNRDLTWDEMDRLYGKVQSYVKEPKCPQCGDKHYPDCPVCGQAMQNYVDELEAAAYGDPIDLCGECGTLLRNNEIGYLCDRCREQYER